MTIGYNYGRLWQVKEHLPYSYFPIYLYVITILWQMAGKKNKCFFKEFRLQIHNITSIGNYTIAVGDYTNGIADYINVTGDYTIFGLSKNYFLREPFVFFQD